MGKSAVLLYGFIRELMASTNVFIAIRSHMFFLVLSLPILPVCWQDILPGMPVKYISETIQVDGNLDETNWEMAESASKFWQFSPTGLLPAQYPTTFRMLYNGNYFTECFTPGFRSINLKLTYRLNIWGVYRPGGAAIFKLKNR
jgi:hypothetical protein